MDPETLKLIGSGSAQVVLAAGYVPMFWMIKVLWSDRAALSDKLMAMLALQFADADKRRDLWDAQAKVIDGQTTVIKDMTREVAGLRTDIQRVKA
jgi:hypothetical protein